MLVLIGVCCVLAFRKGRGKGLFMAHPYAFEIVGEFDMDNEHYYLGRWQCNVEGHNSLLERWTYNCAN